MAKQFRNHFQTGTSNENECVIDKLFVFYETQLIGGVKTEINTFYESSDADFIKSFEGPGRHKFLVKVGSSSDLANQPLENGDPWSIKSNVVENMVTVCGAEIIALTDAAPYILNLLLAEDGSSDM